MMSREQTTAFVDAHVIADPALFIFHVSHCGSTLLSRLLALDPSLRITSEPFYLANFFASTFTWPAARLQPVLETMIRLATLGTSGRRSVVKFTSHALHRLDVICNSFPQVPALLVYREPVAILAASSAGLGFLRRRPAWLLDLLGISHAEGASLTAEALSVAYVRGLFKAAADGAGRFVRLVNYCELPQVLHELRTQVLQSNSPIGEEALQQVLARDSKDPDHPFRRAERHISGDIRAAAQRWLAPHYDALEMRRLQVQPA